MYWIWTVIPGMDLNKGITNEPSTGYAWDCI